MGTIHRKTNRKTQVPMGRRCQERPEQDETHKMDRTSPKSPQMERNCCARPRLYESCSAKQEEGHHGMALPQVADGGTASNTEDSCEYIE